MISYRYIVFSGGDMFYTRGGGRDYHAGYYTKEEAISEAKAQIEDIADWVHVMCAQSGEIIFEEFKE